jgi:uncharacterized protein (TIGR01244 family)
MESPMFLKLDDSISVAGQIAPEDVATAKAQGIVAIVNNRPEEEQPGQPSGDAIKAAADAAGLAYTAIPVDHSGFRQEQVDAMAAALDAAGGPVLAFCRSGTRSTWLWALARATAGQDVEALIAKAGAQGYDIAGLRNMIG